MLDFNDVEFEEKPSSSNKDNPKIPFVLPEDPEAEKIIDIKDLTTNELIDMCFQGIELKSYDGEAFSRTFLARSINSAIAIAEQTFDITIKPKEIINEFHDYEGGSIYSYQFTPLFERPIKEIKEMNYLYGNRQLMKIPDDWIQVDRLGGSLTIFPTSGAMQPISPALGTTLPIFFNRSFVPMGVSVSYVVGMEKKDVPENLLEFIFKRAANSIFEVWGDQIIGAGIASSSLSIDGVSQSIGTTQSAMYGGASARILEYRKDLNELIPIIRRHFARINMAVL